ncbi:MAG: alpha-galactosidase [Kiritimatiellaeota bacterium]|nr:alpha-galactosidase [Kiritimatiellota bacterium]
MNIQSSALSLKPLGCLPGLALLALAAAALAQPPVEPPPNAPATVEWNAPTGRLSLRYHGGVLLEATVRAEDTAGRAVAGVEIKLDPTVITGEKIEQRLTFTPTKPQAGAQLVLRGTVAGSAEAFSAETESEAQKRFPLVRNSVGLSRSLRNNAVYDRRWDWVLTGPADGATRIEPQPAGPPGVAFAWESHGPTLELTFRPRFYQKHREIKYFTPWTYKPWEGSLTGYCTWWSYKGGFSQATLDALLKVFVAKHLPDFGYDYMQFDNCYQIGNGSHPTNWLTWNKGKYPLGWQHAMKTIRDAGMKPGIWVHRVHRPNDPHVKKVGEEHPEWFVQTSDGKIMQYSGFYALNTHNKDAVAAMIRPLYRGLKEQGWEYVKVDGAGDLLSAYNNKNAAEFFKKIGKTTAETWRVWDEVARQELGTNIFLLTCWGVGPGVNSIGLADACRLGSDGFGTGEFQHFNSWNGVVWRNDPDHCDVLGQYYMDNDALMPVFGAKAPVPAKSVIRPALCSMAGGMLMVSDKVEVYQDDLNLEGMKRSAPVLFTVPGQLYDYSGRKPGSYGVNLNGGEPTWWQLEIDRPFDHWSVLARFQWGQKQGDKHVFEYQGLPEGKVAFADLGLASDREYLVFEFWTQKFLGKSKGAFTAPAMDANTGMQAFAIREARPHPWVLSTTRHISQGGVSLERLTWDTATNTLAGKSKVIKDDPYVLTVHLPAGFKLKSAEVTGEKAETANQSETATVRIIPSATKTVEWKLAFTK